MERPPSLNAFIEAFGPDYDTEAEAVADWENELLLYQSYVKGRHEQD